MALYSVQILAAAGVTSSASASLGLAGYVWVVRDISCSNTGAGSAEGLLEITSATGSPIRIANLNSVGASNPGTDYIYSRRIVLPYQWGVKLTVSVGQFDISVSGYLLTAS